jgi:hypothetical protein
VRNNIFYVTNSGRYFALVDSVGVVNLSHNWFKTGWVNCFSTLQGTVNNDGTNLGGTSPGFLNETNNDFALVQGSICINAGTTNNVHPDHPLLYQYVKHQQSMSRPVEGAFDLGAFEYQTPLQKWRKNKFNSTSTNLAISADSADPDSDGISNFFEFAFDLDPTTDSSGGVPTAHIVTSDGVPYLALMFSIQPPPSGLVYTVQTSPDCVTWTDGCSYSDSGNVLNAGETIDVSAPEDLVKTVRMITPVEATSARFMRVTVVPE